jgi:two-component system sensor histidine kinase/response regulator
MFYLNGERANDEEKARLLAENLALLVVSDIEHEYEKIDQSLRSIAEEHAYYANRGAAELSAWLTRMQRRNPALNLLRITDAEGQATYALDRNAGPLMNIADRAYFIRLRDDAQAGLQISPPVLGRSSGKTVILLARRLEDPGGRFAGVAVASIPVDYFQDKFAQSQSRAVRRDRAACSGSELDSAPPTTARADGSRSVDDDRAISQGGR